MARRFGGAIDHRISFGAPAHLNLTGSWAYWLWFRPRVLNLSGGLMVKGANPVRHNLELRDSVTNDALFFKVDLSTADADCESVANTVLLDIWQFVVATYNDTTKTTRLFHGTHARKPAEVAYAGQNIGSGTQGDASASPFYVGVNGIGTSGSTNTDIGMVGVLGREPTPKEIQDLYNDPCVIPGTVLCSELGVGPGIIEIDQSRFRNHGVGQGTGGTPTLAPHVPLQIAWRRRSTIVVPGAVGTLSSTLAALTLAGTGTVDVQGQATPTLAALTSSATGTVAIAGSLAATLGAATLAATGVVDVQGQASNTLAALTAAGVGTVDVQGTLAQTLGGLTGAGEGVVGEAPIEGTLNVTLGALTLAGTAAVEVQGQASPTLAAAALVATGTVEVRAAMGATLAQLQLVAAATSAIQAQLASTLEALSVNAGGAVEIRGTLAVTLDPLTTLAESSWQPFAKPGDRFSTSLVASRYSTVLREV